MEQKSLLADVQEAGTYICCNVPKSSCRIHYFGKEMVDDFFDGGALEGGERRSTATSQSKEMTTN